MLNSTLHYPDSVGERSESNHNPAVANLLRHAYSRLRQAPSLAHAYKGAYELAEACFHLGMSKRQRMRAHYAFGSASLGLDYDRQGIAQLNQAIELAAELPDPGAYAELAYLTAAANHHLFYNHAAIDYASMSLGILRFLARGYESVDPELEINVLVELAASEFELAHYTLALQHLQLARQLTTSLLADHRALGPIIWMESLLFRWRGQPELALSHALAARDIYSRTVELPSSLLSVGRLSGIVTEIALDLAESYPYGVISSGRTAYVDLARPYVKQALRMARETNDTAGLQVATLAQARFDSVAGRNIDRIRVIEGVIERAERGNDPAVLVQAYTTLGKEYSVLGQHDLALDCYRRAVNAVEDNDIPALAAFARRSLLIDREFQV